MTADLTDAKRAARRAARLARRGCNPALGAKLAAHLLEEMPPPPGVAVSGFWPLEEEVDVRPLLAALHSRGHPVLLPQTPPLGQPLVFRYWHPGIAMIEEPFGTR